MDKTVFSPYAAAAGWHALGFKFGLNSLDLAELLKEPLVLNAMTAPINDALKAWRLIDADGYKSERKYGYQPTVHDAILLAKINGSALVIPVANDLKKKVSKTIGFQVVVGKKGDNGFYKVKTKDGEEIDVHADNVFEVFSNVGFRSQTLRDMGVIGGSEVELIAHAYSIYKKGLEELFYLLKRAIVDTRGIKDLAEQMEQAVTDEQKIDIIGKLKAVHEATNGTDNHTGVVYDMEIEKIDRLSISGAFGGLVQIFEQLKNNFVASTGIPEVKIFGSQVGGIGNNDASTLSIYYEKVDQLLQTTIYDLLYWMDDMANLSFGDWSFGSVRQQKESEKVAIEKSQADIDKIYFDMLDTAVQDGILRRIETRYGAIDGSQSTDTTSTN